MGVVRALGRPSFQRTWSKGHTTRSTGGGSGGVLAPGLLPAALRQPGSSQPTGESPPHCLLAASAVSAAKANPSSTGELSQHLPPGRNPLQGSPPSARHCRFP
ncbi:uncharacterized protein N7484_000005 [Penicillium longicatenatum]|uniref:uncharacterized protein n=1 Tax=Penicillium longicatenatum TaxID=1561947 RepID=UPI0025469100|nr:uncharacterized protein N7484_000005 [Penicillium longicatenatum]KAJ5660633.1 hypothetical protein N7484_000005 [Penicillium longicatenatum]